MSPTAITLGEVSVPVIRLTSPAPYARGINSFWIKRPTGPRVEVAEVAVPRHLAAGNHDRSGPEVFLLIDAHFVNRGTVKSSWDERVRWSW